eukprot:472284-Prymnesium_polylepis.1
MIQECIGSVRELCGSVRQSLDALMKMIQAWGHSIDNKPKLEALMKFLFSILTTELGLNVSADNVDDATKPPSGLRWGIMGREQPANGRELTNPKLQKELLRKSRVGSSASLASFTQQEWDTFGITDLQADDFVKLMNDAATDHPRSGPFQGYQRASRARAAQAACPGGTRPVAHDLAHVVGPSRDDDDEPVCGTQAPGCVDAGGRGVKAQG